jgi:TPR repeat protein
MNIKWLLVPALLITLQVHGQATLAKLKYEEAEEAFQANDYTTSLKKLDETEKLLGSGNAKILYLRICAQAAQLKTEPYLNLEQASRLRKNYTEYLTKYEAIEGIEDKYKEVYKISEHYKTLALPEQAFANIAKGNVADMEAIALANEDYGNWPRAHEWYGKAAAKNSALAYSRLALMYMEGWGVTADAGKAREWMDKAVAAGHPSAYYTLYMWHSGGRSGYLKDPVKAEEFLYKSYEAALPGAQKGNAHMLFYAGRALAEGKTQEQEKGWPLLEKAAEKGDYDAAELMGTAMEEGLHGPKDNAKALEYYQLAVEKGSSAAEYRIGELYYKGVDGAPEYEKAAEWFERAASHGQPAGAYMLGDLYFNGRGVTANAAQAIRYLDQAGKKGYPYAWVSLGQIFYGGAGNLAKDYAKAAQYLQQAAEAGEPEGMMQLAQIYSQGGNGLTQEFSKAAYWYKKLADRDSTEAIYLYGKLMYDGYTGKTSESIPWLTKAADKGHKEAAQQMFAMYNYGKGDVKKDKKLAKEWAQRLNGKDPKERAEKLTQMLQGLM